MSEEPRVGDRLYHVRVRVGELPRYVLLPGDPRRVDRIAHFWDKSSILTEHREYRVAIGVYRGVSIAAVSTGIGGPSASIAIEELLRVGSDTFIRVGTTGAITRHVRIGDLIIVTGAVRFDGASHDYAPAEYPAVAHPVVVMALVEAAESLGVRYHVGIVATTSSFYLGQSRPGFRGYMWSRSEQLIKDLSSMNVLSFEMESATILTLSQIYGARASAVLAVIANRVTGEFEPDAGVDDSIRVANEAIKILSEWDELVAKCGANYFYPGLLRVRKCRIEKSS